MNLNPAHLHLMLNHIPLFGALFAALLIGWGLLRKSEDVLRLGLVLGFVVGGAIGPGAGCRSRRWSSRSSAWSRCRAPRCSAVRSATPRPVPTSSCPRRR